MSSLLEIAMVPRQVDVNGKPVDVYGISGRGLAALMARFPEVGKLFSGSEPTKEDMANLGPEGLAAFIAAGLGKPGDAELEEAADRLSLGSQLDLVDEIIRLTFPKGVGPFVNRLRALGLFAKQGVEEAEASVQSSQEQSSSSSQNTKTPSATPRG
jgi:hypothetical protein